jgi:peptide/nickel transport system permease protein
VSARASDGAFAISPLSARLDRVRQGVRRITADPMGALGLWFVLLIVLTGIFADLIAPYDPIAQDIKGRLADPSWQHWLGTDQLGRDTLSRVIKGTQIALGVAVSTTLVSMLIGLVFGLVAGYGPRWLGTAIMRLADVIMSFPSLLLAVIVLYMLSPSVANVILVLAITRIPIYLRTTRAEALEIKERMFVQAAQVMGASSTRIVLRHILPMVIPTLVTIATLDFAFVMLAESALSFLGIGIQPPEITWGLMVAQGKQYLANAWWLAFWPGLAIILTTLSLNLLSNWLRIALDPAQRWRLEISHKGGK